jgi:hypothetical protein
MELIEELINHRNQEVALRRLVIEGVVVNAETPGISAFRTKRTGAENADVLGRMMPWVSMASH